MLEAESSFSEELSPCVAENRVRSRSLLTIYRSSNKSLTASVSVAKLIDVKSAIPSSVGQPPSAVQADDSRGRLSHILQADDSGGRLSHIQGRASAELISLFPRGSLVCRRRRLLESVPAPDGVPSGDRGASSNHCGQATPTRRVSEGSANAARTCGRPRSRVA